MAKEVTKEQKELIRRLEKIGFNRNVAKTLVHIASNEETVSREIESIMGLRQPEVSVAVNELKDRDWIKVREIKKEGRGRPVHGYSLNGTIEDIVTEIRENEKKKIKEIEENINKIEDLAKAIS
ncbi:MAG: MarR family transcriptional regulator [Thermoplasmatota archaeon]